MAWLAVVCLARLCPITNLAYDFDEDRPTFEHLRVRIGTQLSFIIIEWAFLIWNIRVGAIEIRLFFLIIVICVLVGVSTPSSPSTKAWAGVLFLDKWFAFEMLLPTNYYISRVRGARLKSDSALLRPLITQPYADGDQCMCERVNIAPKLTRKMKLNKMIN